MTPIDTIYRPSVAVLLCAVVLLAAGPGTVATEPTANHAAAIQPTTTATADGQGTSVQNLSAPDEVRLGTDFTVSATVVNPGEWTVQRVSYRIGGNVIDDAFVAIPANSTATVSFDVAASDTSQFSAGTFTHGVFTDDARATANLTFTEATETATAARTTVEGTTAADQTTTADQTTAVSETTTAVAGATTTAADAREADVTFEDQVSNGTAVTLQSVTVSEGGFVVVHDTSLVRGNITGSILGTSRFLEAGTHRNVTVQLDQPVSESQRLVAVAYRDSNDDEEFDFVESGRTIDGPYTEPDGEEAVNDIASVEVATGNETTEA